MNIKAVFLFIVLMNVNSLIAQSNDEWIDNDRFEYKVVRVSLQLKKKGKAVPSKHLIISDLPDSIKVSARKLGKDYFLKLLTSEKTDWATNLFLYEIFQRDAFLFISIRNKEQWKLSLRAKDIAFWKKNLSSMLRRKH